ncbi:MAG: DUF2161 domain-containing phosphodiesterase [Beutenbergiaceae bacterium]
MPLRETDLYLPVKALLTGQGYQVKGEVGAADVVALHPDAPDEPVIVELKTGFSLTLLHQAIARQALSDAVYVAVPRGRGRRWQSSLTANKGLCRRLGLGLMLVRTEDGQVEVALDPAPFRPRKSAPRRRALLREFLRREGDPNQGGAASSGGTITAYRQDAERIRAYLDTHGPCRAAVVARATGLERARQIMADNHYGWFERASRGIYQLRQGHAHQR